jgi:bacterioferritin-associated ferredoxin
MYVCICNAVRESEIKDVIAEGVRDVDDVYTALDIEPQCGTCRSYISELLALVPSAKESEIAA